MERGKKEEKCKDLIKDEAGEREQRAGGKMVKY